MKFVLRGASSAALILGIAGGFQTAIAQEGQQGPAPQTVTTTQTSPQADAPQTAADQLASSDDQAAGERITVVGSLIATAPEDAAKPVEVYTAEDLKAQGTPSISEFVRSLTSSGSSDLGFGQASADIPEGGGFANADLRGLGPNGTLVLMNGRRVASTNGGFGADLNTLPTEALEAVEVLKDGASTTYGAGAVGGVLNFRTRRDIDAPQISVERTMYDGSEGAYKIDFTTGWVGDVGNILLSLSHSHEAAMLASKRDFASLPFSVNPQTWTLTGTNPGRFHSSSNFLSGTPLVGAGINDLPGSTGAAAQAACEAIGGGIVNVLQPGGVITGTTTPNTVCGFAQAPFQDLVNENDTTRFYGEINVDLSDTMEFHLDATYSSSKTYANRLPVDGPSARAMDSAVSALTCAGSCFYAIPTQVSTYTAPAGTSVTAPPGVPTNVFTRNPFIDDFMARTGVTVPTTGALYTSSNWRPFMYGGNPYFPGGLRRERYDRERILLTAGLKGEFTRDGLFGFLDGINYDYSATYNQYMQTYTRPDVIVSRLQNALLGYGGPGCNAVDRVPTDYSSAAAFNRTVGIQSDAAPGTNGCQWFNPFASAWPTSIVNGAPNPMFNSGTIAGRPTGYQNPVDLIDWMLGDRIAETQYQATTIEATFTGEVPGFELPGGPIGWAAGTQWRMLEARTNPVSDDPAEELLNKQRCPWNDPAVVNVPAQPQQAPGQRGCTTGSGAFNTGGLIAESYGDSQTLAFYGELQLPILDNLNVSASVRREEYNGGKVTGDIWNVAGKYDITDNLYVRASYGTNFRAEEALDYNPGEVEFDADPTTRFGTGFVLERITEVSPNLGPEDDKNFSAGVGYNMDIGEGRLRLEAGFFEITINGEVTTTTTTAVFNNVFGLNTSDAQANRGIPGIPNTGTQGSPNQYADCNARLIGLLTFAGPCVQGVTTAADLVGSWRSVINGPRRVTNGFDYTADFSYPLFGGMFGANVNATNNLVYKTQGYDVNGIQFELPQNRMGFYNTSLAVPQMPDWRANATLRWANDQHSFNLRANYRSGVQDERDPRLPAGLYQNAGDLVEIVNGTPDVYSLYGLSPEDYLDFDFTYIYTAPFWEELEMRLTVLNITDEDPPAYQSRLGYSSSIGNPRGRQVELGVSKKF